MRPRGTVRRRSARGPGPAEGSVNAGEERKRSRWLMEGATVLLLAFSVVLLVTNILPTRKHLSRMREEQRRLIGENTALAHSIEQLDAMSEALENDPATQERAYRNDFRYREPGEKVIYFEEE